MHLCTFLFFCPFFDFFVVVSPFLAAFFQLPPPVPGRSGAQRGTDLPGERRRAGDLRRSQEPLGAVAGRWLLGSCLFGRIRELLENFWKIRSFLFFFNFSIETSPIQLTFVSFCMFHVCNTTLSSKTFQPQKPCLLPQVAASGVAGFTSACVSTPADVVKTRLMNAAGEDVKQYRGRFTSLEIS